MGRGVVTVTRDVRLYKEDPFASESKESETVKSTKTRPIEYDSTAFWLDIPRDKLISWRLDMEDTRASPHALEHAIRSVKRSFSTFAGRLLMASSGPEYLVGADEAARYLQVTTRGVKDLARAGSIPAHPSGMDPARSGVSIRVNCTSTWSITRTQNGKVGDLRERF